MQISVVIPLFNEEESLSELVQWIQKVMQQNGFSFEIILVDDGSKDRSWSIIEELSKQHSFIKGIRFRRNYGKSAGLHIGFSEAEGDVVITMDADLQDSPDEIPSLYNMIAHEGYDLVSGWKKKRFDPITKTIPTKLYNWATRKMSGIELNDFNCGLKAYKNEVVKSVEVYGEMHRYIPVLAKRAGYNRIGEKVVQHQARKYGHTKFGMSRFLYGPLDLLTVSFMSTFSKRPMHIFGGLGLLSFFIGFCILLYFLIDKIFFGGVLMTLRPLFYLGVISLILGSQLFLTGFVGELISRSSADRNNYLINKKVGF